jgi:DNA-binding MarR family transcriptional regulator
MLRLPHHEGVTRVSATVFRVCAPTPSPDAGDETLADAFRAVTRQLRQQTQRALAPWNVTPSQARALGMLNRHGPLRLGALSEHLRIAPRSTTEVVDALQEAGLVARSPDPVDRRATLVALTERGAEAAAGIRAARAAEAEEFFARLDDADRAGLTRLLQLLRS